MTDFTKGFIEGNFNLIESKDYEQFFADWYKETMDQDSIVDFMELAEVFRQMGIWDETEEARRNVLCQVADVIVSHAIGNDVQDMDLTVLMQKIGMSFGLTLPVATKIVKEHLKQEYEFNDKLKRFYFV